MKRLLYFMAILSVLMSCKKTSYVPVFDKTPQERAAEQINLVSTTLSSAPNGWIATLPTLAGGGYSFYIAFDGKQGVTMYGDMTTESAGTVGTSNYRVKQDIGTELVFDTYNYISMLDDPNSAILGGASKVGYSSDIEFTFDRLNGDSIIFVGKKYRQPFKLVKATAAQQGIYTSGGFLTAINKLKDFFVTNKYPYIEVVSGAATLKVGVSLNATNNLTAGKRATLTGVLADGITTASGTGKFSFNLSGADILGDGLVYQGIKFVRFFWKDATTLVMYDSAGKEYIVKSSPTPITPLYLLLGSGYGVVTIPNATTYPGWSADYVTRRADAANKMLTGGYALRLEQTTYTFNNVAKKLTIRVNMPQNTTQYVGTINYTYTKSDSGIFKFTYVDADGNGNIIVPFMAALLAQRLNVDTFTVDYFTHPTTGALLAQFKSIEHPDFTFTGGI
ncbi:DUF4302 domain-containing protein [Pedobacter sp. GSP4]|uniref:DUF4302 domain-containing protein n=1 Tax=Pedobacter sp. GSP4 TaxID=3453716 RepID=UPI003EEB6735